MLSRMFFLVPGCCLCISQIEAKQFLPMYRHEKIIGVFAQSNNGKCNIQVLCNGKAQITLLRGKDEPLRGYHLALRFSLEQQQEGKWKRMALNRSELQALSKPALDLQQCHYAMLHTLARVEVFLHEQRGKCAVSARVVALKPGSVLRLRLEVVVPDMFNGDIMDAADKQVKQADLNAYEKRRLLKERLQGNYLQLALNEGKLQKRVGFWDKDSLQVYEKLKSVGLRSTRMALCERLFFEQGSVQNTLQLEPDEKARLWSDGFSIVAACAGDGEKHCLLHIVR